MATSGSTTVQIFSWISMKFAWEQVSQSIANNTTTIKWTLSATTTSAGAVYVSNRKWAVTIDGTEYTGTVKVSLDKGSTQTLASDTVTIKHNESGSKSFDYSFSQQFNLTLNSGKYMGTYEGNGTGTLENIPRLSSMSVTSGELGQVQTITVTRKSTSFRHSIKVECGSTTFYIKADGTTSSVADIHDACNIKWTPALDLAIQSPQKDPFNVRFTITTHNLIQSLGTSTTTASYSLPARYRPPLSFYVTDINGVASTIGQYIQGRSAIKVDIDTYSVYGAWIKSCVVDFDGKTYSVKAENGAFSVQTDTISGSGTLKMTVTVTDSRDRVTTTSHDFNVLPYKIPRITQLYAYRCDDDQLKDPRGGNIGIKFMAECSAIPMGVRYIIGYKRPSDELYNEIELDEYTNETLVNDGFYLIENAGDTSLEIVLSVHDSFSAQVTETVTAPGLKKFISLMKKNGDIVGIAINKVAEHEGYFDIGMPVLFSGGVGDDGAMPVLDTDEGDMVVEQGTADGWTYRKWSSGMAECRKTVVISTAISTAWGTMYVGNTKMSRQSYPFVFTAKPLEVASVTTAANAVWLFAESGGNGVNGAYQTAIYNVCRPSAVSAAATYYITIDAKGRWK